MDAKKVWQWRIMHVKKYSTHPEPFYHSNRIGLDFNVASNTQKKLDLELVTNGVILEVCDFAKTVNRRKRRFMTNILENNFDLGLENEQQRITFIAQTHNKVKDLIKKPPKDKSEVFTLFDTSCKPECNSNSGLNLASTEHKTESFLVEIDDTDDSEHEDEFRCSQATSNEYMKTESLSEEMDEAPGDDSDNEDELKCSGAQSAEELKEDVLPPLFPCCERIGLNLDVGSKQSLDLGLLTKGVMLELVNFTRILTSSYSTIVLDMLEHNFDLDLKSQQEKNRVWFKISYLLRRRKQLSKINPKFKYEPFSFQTHPFKRTKGSALSNMEVLQYHFKEVTKRRQSDLKSKQEKRALLTTSQRMNKRRRRGVSKGMDTNSLCHHTDLYTSRTAEQDHCHTFLRGESYQKSDTHNQHHLINSKSCCLSSDIPRESESSCLGGHAPFLNCTDVASTLPTSNSNVNPRYASQPNKRQLCGDEEQIQTPRKCDMEQEEMVTENNYTFPLEESDLDSDIGNEYEMEPEEIGTENNYTCPLGESDQDSDKFTDSGNTGKQDHLQKLKSCFLSSDIPRELASSHLGICAPFFTSTDISSTSPAANSNMNPPFASQLNEREFYGGEEQTETPRKVPNECNMEQKEMGTENIMWKLRANRVKQILSSPNKEFGAFFRSKKFGLEYNVGFGPKRNISVDCLPNYVLLEVTKFALAMNSSQRDFIMEILEYNFDFGLQTQHQRSVFTCELMNRVRKLKSCEDTVKFSKEVFQLYGPMSSINMANQIMGSVNHELISASRLEECDIALVDPPHSHAETKQHISQKTEDLYPFCREIGLKLHVNQRKQNKKLDINKLTNGAMIEVTNFAEKLCGTFEQICLDILRHNIDLDSQNGDSDLGRNILARIPAIVGQKNLSDCASIGRKIKGTKKDSSTMVKLDCQNVQNLDACSAGSSQAAIIDRDVGSSTDIEHQNELNLKLWKLRGNHIQHILSIPHEEHCPLYSYSRCKKLGIDFNVGSGVKQNLDPKLLTNGIMVELNTLATALLSAQKYFITEILEYNFHLDFNDELHRSAFAQQTLDKIRATQINKKYSIPRMKMLFELPNVRCIEELTSYCPKCYEDRKHKLHQNDSEAGHVQHSHPHTMIDTVSADANCTAQKPARDPSSTFSTIEDMIMDSYPLCKKINLNLCVNKDQPKDKLDTHVLTRGIINEVARFTKLLCGKKNKIINDVLEYNFNIDIQGRGLNVAALLQRVTAQNRGRFAWFNEVYVFQQYLHRQPGNENKMKLTAAMQRSEWKETVKKRKLTLQTKKRTQLPSHNISVVKSRTRPQSKGNGFTICTEIGLDLDMTSKSGEDEKLDMKLLTRAVCDMEQEKMGTDNNYTCPVGESDLDSDEVTHSGNTGNQDHLQNPKRSLSSDIYRESESSCLGIRPPVHTTTDISSSLPADNSNVTLPFASQPNERGLCGGEEQTQTPRNAPNKCDMEQLENGTENMWKLRANRVKQILSTLKLGPFYWSKKVGLEFDVGFGPKQNISVDSLPNSALLEVAKFALAMNSSQQHFTMEILEYNFDFYLKCEHQKNVLACEIMSRIRQLKDCADAIKISKEIFELPGLMPSINMANQSMGSVSPELSNISRMEECNVAPGDSPHSHGKTKKVVSQTIVDLYPFCREIGLKLHVNQCQQNKKLDINKLTNGAMLEVTNFAEKLCGTFEQICLDILRHNLDLEAQNGDSDLARSIIVRIPAVVDRNNLSTCVKAFKTIKCAKKDSSTKAKLECQNNLALDACSAGSSQPAIRDQDVGSSTDIEHQDELSLTLWKLRASHIQHILSIPHEEHCPLYSYSRCKKLGIDFNVGSGVKQNLDPKLLTSGVMVELSTFAIALLSAQKHFITEILEYNFHLDFNDELHRLAFAQQTLDKIRGVFAYKNSPLRMKMPFELPDTRYIQEPTYEKYTYCPKCYHDRKHKLLQDKSNTSHMHHSRPHTMTETVSADANCTAQNPAKDLTSAFSKIEEMIMDSYPLCKKIGLNLCVDKALSKDKLDKHVLTRGIVVEVANFAKQLCATKSRIFHAVLEHNFDIDMQRQDVDFAQLFSRVMALKDDRLAAFSEVFVIQPLPHKQPGHASKLDVASPMQRSEVKETVKKRKMAMQTKEERATLLPHNISVLKKPKKSHQSKFPENCYPICTKIGLDLDVTSKSGEKEKLDLKLLTRAVVLEIHKFANKKTGHYLPHTVFDILDYNFDLSSQHHRRWEFSIATTSKVQSMVKQHRRNRNGIDEVFKLPFVFAPENTQNKKPEKYSREEPDKKTKGGRFVRQVRYHSDANHIHFLDGVKTNEEAWFHDEDTNFSTDPGTIVQMNGSLVSVGCGSPLQENTHIKEEENDPHYGNMKPEPDTEEKYHPHYDDVKTEPNTEDIKHLVPGEPSGPLGYTLLPLWPNPERQEAGSENQNVQYYILAEQQGSAVCPNTASNIKTEWDAECVKYLVPVEAAGSQEYSMVIIGQDNESTLIKEEQENVPIGSHHY